VHMGDPLSVLRAHTAAGRFREVKFRDAAGPAADESVPVGERDGEYEFPAQQVSFHAFAPTAFRSATGYYPLIALVTVWEMREQKPGAYITHCTAQKIPRVAAIHKAKVLAYLSKPDSVSDLVDPVPPAPIPPARGGAQATSTTTDIGITGEKRPGSGAAAGSASPAKRARVDGMEVDQEHEDSASSASPEAVLRGIFAREEQLSTRNTVLQSEKQAFGDIIVKVNKQIKEDKVARQRAEMAAKKKKQSGASANSNANRPRHDRYQTVEEKSFAKERLGLGDGDDDLADLAPLDARAGFGSGGSGASSSSSHSGSSSSGSSALSSSSAPSSSSSQQRSASRSQRASNKQQPRRPREESTESSFGAVDAVPIIVVPKAVRSLVSIANIRDLLVGGKYVPPGEAKRPNGPSQSRGRGELEIEREGRKYLVVDNPRTLSAEQWKRVVALFCLGKEWQLKEMRETDPVKLFQDVAGFYLKYDDDPALPEAIGKWRVAIEQVSKTKPHVAATAVLSIWKKIDSFIATRKADVFPPAYSSSFA
jgi:RNA pol II accessory factor, Cdc73 family, C-terminal